MKLLTILIAFAAGILAIGSAATAAPAIAGGESPPIIAGGARKRSFPPGLRAMAAARRRFPP